MSSSRIFISYSSADKEIVEKIVESLEADGLKCWISYRDIMPSRPYPQEIMKAILDCDTFLVILTDNSFKSGNVLNEIDNACNYQKKIMPVLMTDSDIPLQFRYYLSRTQFVKVAKNDISSISTLLGFKESKPEIISKTSFFEKHGKWLLVVLALLAIFACFAIAKFFVSRNISELKRNITFDGQEINWQKGVTKGQLLTIKDILDDMCLIEGGEFMQGVSLDGVDSLVEVEFEVPAFATSVKSFYLNKYEVTIGQWNAIMQESVEGDVAMPIGSISFTQAKHFAEQLSLITQLPFRLPTEAEWEYAAKGGERRDDYRFAGSNDPLEVAWYAGNSDGVAHSNLCSTSTYNGLFNMSGNLCEWCDTYFLPYNDTVAIYDENVMVIRGGNYSSDLYELTVTHREPVLPETSIPMIGFRLAMSK